MEAVADAPKRLTLDTRDLTIHGVLLLAAAVASPAAPEEGQPLSHSLGDKHEVWNGPCHLLH